MGFTNLIGQPVVMHEDRPAGLDDDTQHRPQIGQRSQQADSAELREIRVRVGMIEPELTSIIVPPRLPPLQQHASSRVVQLAIVQNDEARIADQIRPHVVVARRVAELIDDEIVRARAIFPDEVVRVEQLEAFVRRFERRRRPVDEQIDVVFRREPGQEIAAVPGNAGSDGRKRAEPRESWHIAFRTVSSSDRSNAAAQRQHHPPHEP